MKEKKKNQAFVVKEKYEIYHMYNCTCICRYACICISVIYYPCFCSAVEWVESSSFDRLPSWGLFNYAKVMAV